MAQQQPAQNRLARLAPLLVLYALFFGWWFFFAPKGPQTPAAVQNKWDQAQALEKEGKTADPNLALADRVKKLNEAISRYEEFYNANKESPDPAQRSRARQARFNEVNLLDYLAVLEGKKAGTHWYDQAELKLKDMEKAFHGKVDKVVLEKHRLDGAKIVADRRVYEGDLSLLATERLNEIRAERDVVNQGKVLYRVLGFLVNLCGGNKAPHVSYWLALLLVVVVIKLATYPLLRRQYKSQKDMARVAPLIKEAQERMKQEGRPQDEISREIFRIYRENNVNLMGGCLPTLVLMFALFPVFFMIKEFEYQFTHGTFFWIGSDYARTVWWMADNLAQFDVILFVTYTASMILYSLIQPKPTDPQQAQMQKMMLWMMPVMVGWFMWQYQWSSAFMLYWLFLNLVSMIQSWMLMRQFGLASTMPAGTEGKKETAPPPPLTPMKKVHTESPAARKNGRNGRPGPNGLPPAPGRVRPKGASRKKK